MPMIKFTELMLGEDFYIGDKKYTRTGTTSALEEGTENVFNALPNIDVFIKSDHIMFNEYASIPFSYVQPNATFAFAYCDYRKINESTAIANNRQKTHVSFDGKEKVVVKRCSIMRDEEIKEVVTKKATEDKIAIRARAIELGIAMSHTNPAYLRDNIKECYTFLTTGKFSDD